MARAFRTVEGSQQAYDPELEQLLQNAIAGGMNTAGVRPGVLPSGRVEAGGEAIYEPGNWGTAGYADAASNPEVWLDGHKWTRTGQPGPRGGVWEGRTFQGRPYSYYDREDPTYGSLQRSDALADAGRFNRTSLADYLPGALMGLAGGAAFAGFGGAGAAGAGSGAGVAAGGAMDMGLGLDVMRNSFLGLGEAAGGGAGAAQGLSFYDQLVNSMSQSQAGQGLQSVAQLAGEAGPGGIDFGGEFATGSDSWLPGANNEFDIPYGGGGGVLDPWNVSADGSPFATGSDSWLPGTNNEFAIPYGGAPDVSALERFLKLVTGGKSLVGSGGIFDKGGLIGGGLDLAARTAPGLLALNYAKNQDPFDMSRLENLYGKFGEDPFHNPNLLSYDLQSGQGRNKLQSSLTQRGVMGSSFGNFDLGSYDTLRGLGRSGIVGQGLTQQAGIANNILQAQVQERALKNQLYGRAFDVLGRGVNPGPTLYSAPSY